MDTAFVALGPPRSLVRHSIARCQDQPSAICPHQSSHQQPTLGLSRPVKWARVAISVAGITLGSLWPDLPGIRTNSAHQQYFPTRPAVAADVIEVPILKADGPIPLHALGIKVEDYVSHRELARRKTTQYSEAEEEIMELEEDDYEYQWYYNMRTMWAAIGSVGGIYVLYRGGVLWERWIQEQERKDMEEEIELTGTFIDPRAVRKDKDDAKNKPKNTDGDSPDLGPPLPSSGPRDPGSDPNPDLPRDIDALERMFGKS